MILRHLTKRVVLTSAIAWVASQAIAVPAFPDPVEVMQPDGTTLTVLVHGDEYYSYLTTLDGYTVINTDGSYCYALPGSSGELGRSDVLAHDVALRPIAEADFLKNVSATLVPGMKDTAVSEKRAESARRQKRRIRIGEHYDYSKFRGLVVLIEFNDRQFIRDDANGFFDEMLNKQDYTGYESVKCTGSVRDYFSDNSGGMFAPHFDVLGPVKLNRSVYDVLKYVKAPEIGAEALKSFDDTVDFSKYDTDGDGVVDMVFFIYAGTGSNTGNDERLLWPHASTLIQTGLELDGVTFDSYACSTELRGSVTSGMIDGIGTICHEFSHVLGLPDFYDVDYSGSGGASTDPGKWSVMAYGSYLNDSRTPCGYSLFERIFAGFTTPEVIEQSGDYTIEPLSDKVCGYRLNTPDENEFFIIENRQQRGWDEYLPGHGMLVFRVDFTDPAVWENNRINAYPGHNYYELLRAKFTRDPSTGLVVESSYDPYPGSGLVTDLNNQTTPSLRTWSGLNNEYTLSEIKESDGKVSFHVDYNPVSYITEDCENLMSIGEDLYSGVFCNWSFSGVEIVATEDSGMAMKFSLRGTAETSIISDRITSLSFEVTNPASTDAKVRLYIKKGDSNWIALKDYNLSRDVVIPAGQKASVYYEINNEEPVAFRIMQSGGSSSDSLFVDNISLEAVTYNSGVAEKIAEEPVEMTIRTEGRYICVTGGSKGNVSLYTIAGVLADTAQLCGNETVLHAPQAGIYIVRNNMSYKLIHVN